MNNVGICAGSFDPITFGHSWLIEKSINIVDHLYVAIGNNKNKKYMFSFEEREDMILESLQEQLIPEDFNKISIVQLHDSLLINKAQELKATHIIRGIRDIKDFEYERQMQIVNSKIDPRIETLFLMTPQNLSELSSSIVKEIAGYKNWETLLKNYVHDSVIEALKNKI